MKKEHLHLLIVLKSGGNLNGMRKYGYEFDEILTYLKELIAENLVLRTDELIELTEFGLDKLKEQEKEQNSIKPSNPNTWILPDYKNKLKRKNSLSDPFIPNKLSLERIIKKVKENM